MYSAVISSFLSAHVLFVSPLLCIIYLPNVFGSFVLFFHLFFRVLLRY